MLKNIQIKVKILNKPWNKMFFGFVDTMYGQIVLGASSEGGLTYIGYLHFSEGRSIEYFANDIGKHWPQTECVENEQMAQTTFSNIFLGKEQKLVYVALKGTDFQSNVWLALLKIPYGVECTYGEVAAMINRPEAVRAVSNAVANNNIALFVPCHRVKAKHCDKHNYRWGSDLKIKILLDEKRNNE